MESGEAYLYIRKTEVIINIPALPDVDPNITLLMPDHFEFLYFENHHHDVVVSSATGKVCADHPVLAGVNNQSCVIELSTVEVCHYDSYYEFQYKFKYYHVRTLYCKQNILLLNSKNINGHLFY